MEGIAVLRARLWAGHGLIQWRPKPAGDLADIQRSRRSLGYFKDRPAKNQDVTLDISHGRALRTDPTRGLHNTGQTEVKLEKFPTLATTSRGVAGWATASLAVIQHR